MARDSLNKASAGVSRRASAGGPSPLIRAAATAWVILAAAATGTPAVASWAPSASHYPSLCSEGRTRTVEAYLQAYSARPKDVARLSETRQRLLTLHGEAWRAFLSARAASPEFDRRLRLLWDLAGLVHATQIPPATVKRAIHWTEPKANVGAASHPIAVPEAARAPLLAHLGALPSQTRLLLKSVAAGRGQSFWDYVAAKARQVYLTTDLFQWSPACTLDVCGSSEPLTRTLILVPVSAIDLQPKPDWSLAAVAVHESAHIEWFHRPEVSRDPRLLLPVPNERNAWRVMAIFLNGLLRGQEPSVRTYVSNQRQAIEAQLRHARAQVLQANRVLGLNPADMSLVLTVPRGLSESALRSLSPQ